MAFQSPFKLSSIEAYSNGTLSVLKGGKYRAPGSFAAILAAFIPTFLVAIIQLGIFALVRSRYPKIYSPRTYIGTVPEQHRTPSSRNSRFDWIHTLRVVDDKFLLYHQSLDAYLFIRFLRTIVFICVIGCFITWPILMPINANGGGTSTEVDRVGVGNVSKKSYLYAHAVVAWIFFGLIMFLVARERIWLISVRQAWAIAKSNARKLSSRTVLFLSAPKESLNENNMHRFFGEDAQRIWPVTKGDKLESLASGRNGALLQLEGAEMTFIHNLNDKGRKAKNNNTRNGTTSNYDAIPEATKQSLRPTHRLKTTPPIGKQVDTLQWSREQVKEKEDKLQEARESYTAPDRHGAAAVFVEFRTQTAAQRALQQVSSSQILALGPRYTGVVPKEVIWSNLTIQPAARISQDYSAQAIVAAIIIFWSIPVAFVGAISNVEELANKYHWLSWIHNLPGYVVGLISGLVPPLLTSLLSSYVPNIFRSIFKSFGEPTNTAAELKVQNWYFVFQVLQVFLVTSLSSAAAAVVGELAGRVAQDPTSVPRYLASNIPRASNFYLTYFILQGVASAAQNVLNYSDLLQYLFYDRFFDKTPRQKYERHTQMKGIAWGKVFPKFTNFAIIAIVYACIQPLVLGFAAAGIYLYYLSYRYNLLYVIQAKVDTKGHAYTKALQHLLTGIYLAELVLIGLFGIQQATGPSIMLGILFISTIIYNYTMNRYLGPLEQYLPANISAESDMDDSERAPLLSAAEEGEAENRSHIQRIGTEARIPKQVTVPLSNFFEPKYFGSHKKMSAWLADGDFDDEVPEYSEDDIKKAYLNPAFTSKTPKLWLARDPVGASKREIGENEEAGLTATDEGAWLDEQGRVKWNERDFSNVPIFKEPVKY